VEAVIEARSSNDSGELARSLRGMGVGSQPSLGEELAGLEVHNCPIMTSIACLAAGEPDSTYYP
jgi:hypothetical protein